MGRNMAMMVEAGGEGLITAEQFYALSSSSPHCP
jgi:hypothetical protein